MSETSKNSIPDSILPYLNEIAERLWSRHAAVMVGAGFSRNAKPNSASCPVFPDWSQLGDLFYEKIHGIKPGIQSKYLSVPKLADEVQAALGRPVLDQILRNAIPDLDYEPSPLHERLLNLPWSDVFTTNYDTLLERACDAVISQRYDVVVNKGDLTFSQKPRIIKLHGSLRPDQSDQQVVITEEDYRRFPEDFAPFLNTVRQTLLENTLCLVGFSGDDPNFVQWVGWIRDNLGQQNAPRVYLIGLFSLSNIQKKLLEQRNIVPVDLSEYHDISGNHYKALEWFLKYLHSRKSEDNRLGWPKDSELLLPDTKKDKIAQLSQLLPVWKKQRLSFPGWVNVPEDRRSVLWEYTWHWLHYLSEADSLSDHVDLEFAFELSWRMEKCLCPVFSNQIAFFEAILEKYLPHADVETPTDSFHMRPTEIDSREPDRNDIWEKLQHLLLWMLRFYREEGLLEKWVRLREKIQQNVDNFSAEHKANFCYERALFALFGLNLQELKEILAKWQVNESLPFWEAKRAGLLAEIGQVDEAKKILERSLKDIRSKLNLKSISSDYSLVSQESYTMLLLQYVQTSVSYIQHEWSKNRELRNEFSERWNALNQYKCDPWHELKIFESTLKNPPVKKSEVTERKEFDIGRVTRTYHSGRGVKETLIAYSFLRFCEDAGVPFRITGSIFGKEAAEGTLSRTMEYSPYWARATMVRIGDAKVVHHIFNRASLSKKETASVDSLVERYLGCLEQNVAGIRSGSGFLMDNFEKVLARIVPEILSRLCCKCSSKSRDRLFDFLLNVYQSDHRGKYGEIRNLTERLLSAYPAQQRYDLIPRLLDFPVVKSSGSFEARNFINPFHFLNLAREWTETWDKPIILDEKVNVFLERALSDHSHVREWAITTLGKLHYLGQLEHGQTNKFAEALWSNLDDFGLPAETDYYQNKFAFLELPHPPNIDPILLFKKFVQGEPFPVRNTREDQSISYGRDIPLCKDIVRASIRIEWSDDDVNSILGRLVAWWDADKEYLKEDDRPTLFGSVVDELKDRFAHLVDVLTAVISANFNPGKENSRKEKLRRLVDELGDYGIPTLRLQSACLPLYPAWRDDLFEKIEIGMTSSNHAIVIDCLKAILVIAERSESDADKNDFSRILHVLAQMVRWQKNTGLPSALYTITELTKKFPWVFTEEFERLTLIGLRSIARDATPNVDGVDFADLLEIRRTAASLAYILFEHYTRQDNPVPDVITEWKKICLSDNEFAEVRNQWIRHQF